MADEMFINKSTASPIHGATLQQEHPYRTLVDHVNGTTFKACSHHHHITKASIGAVVAQGRAPNTGDMGARPICGRHAKIQKMHAFIRKKKCIHL